MKICICIVIGLFNVILIALWEEKSMNSSHCEK